MNEHAKPLSAEELAEIEARVKALPIGPWWVPELDTAAAFAAHARTDVPRLIATVRALEDENAKLRSCITDLESLLDRYRVIR